MFLNKWVFGAMGAVSLGLAAMVGTQIAQQPAAPAPAAAQSKDADPALWVVRDDDTTIYLFGTVHVLQPGLSWFDEAVKTAFDASDEVVLELVLPDDATAQAAVMKYGINTTGPTLTERLPADKREPYIKSLANIGIPANGFDKLQPWFAANNITALTLQKSGYDMNSGAEKVITDAAKAAGKPVSGLETLDQQLSFFAGLSPETQLRYLTMTVDDVAKGTETIEKMVGMWSEGEPEQLGELMNEAMEDIPELGDVLLTDRNARWTDWIVTRMAKPGTVFIAVGAGHLAGDDSVQAMLAKRNLKATRIDY